MLEVVDPAKDPLAAAPFARSTIRNSKLDKAAGGFGLNCVIRGSLPMLCRYSVAEPRGVESTAEGLNQPFFCTQ